MSSKCLLNWCYSVNNVRACGYHVTFHDPDLVIDRPEKFGGRVTFSTYEELKEAYVKEEVYPLDLKNSVANQLNQVVF